MDTGHQLTNEKPRYNAISFILYCTGGGASLPRGAGAPCHGDRARTRQLSKTSHYWLNRRIPTASGPMGNLGAFKLSLFKKLVQSFIRIFQLFKNRKKKVFLQIK
jgi:hypothetical protein